jgi:hypothetical protein
MKILARCPRCDAGLALSAAEAPKAIACGRCGREIALSVSDSVRADRQVDSCPICRGADFYRRKDFDPKAGVAVVAAGALVSAVFYWFGRDLIAYGILAGAVVVDLIVYQILGDATVCYRCHSEFRGAYRRTAPGFDLHTADMLEPEYERRVGRR